ncbi:TPA: dTMP kinase [Candidatus Woesearchaeota archaeon]|nr:dTMP kinase [Candidatus Woesearchaeota archaeon]HIH31739.1 dTMP kinase [Candidatus Woesearchaeota archaeon]HIH54709.1 dTMP kinase [Candidatus Woesearchaeota archaeon]HIJ01422.1 dTMP kinase [Candidatus Woesearchaeota archaeon]HIJ13990.1 dTMP kinase [Candidatus Woesearchaeota archaeon]
MLITFEGIDFCGKSTQVKLLERYLIDKHINVYVFREPGGTKIGELIRGILFDRENLGMRNQTEFFLFSASRAQLIREKVKPYLKQGYYVLSDRLHDSSTAYQGYGRGLDLNAINTVNNLALGNIIPDLTFIINITVEEMNKRKSQKLHRELDRIELNDNDFYQRVRDGYLQIADKYQDRIKIIDGTKSIDMIHREIMKIIEEYRSSDFL